MIRQPEQHRLRGVWFFAAVALATLLAGGLRWHALNQLPLDYDEPVYYNSARSYAQVLRAGNLAALPHADDNIEHPALSKLLYGAVLAPSSPAPAMPVEPSPLPDSRALSGLHDMRLLSTAFGTLTVLVAAIASPAAGFFLAIHTYTIKYTSQAFLEALPMLASAVSVLAYVRSERRANGWLAVSGIALGLAAASKYAYAAAGFAILLDWLLQLTLPLALPRREHGEKPASTPRDLAPRKLAPRSLAWLAGWGMLALLVFVAANPYLWPAPLARLQESLSLLASRASSEHNQLISLGRLQPLTWFFAPLKQHPGIIFTRFDTLTGVLAVVGLARCWRERRVMVLWLAVSAVLLAVWLSRLPHYALVMAVPVTFCAAAGATTVVEQARSLLGRIIRHSALGAEESASR